MALLLAAASIGALAQSPQSANELAGPALLSALRAGGYVIYFRHSSTDFSKNDNEMRDFADCSKQRNLTDDGRREARAIGAAFSALGIPVGDVIASPFCRTMESARLITGRAKASTAVGGDPKAPEEHRYDPLKQLLSERVPPGANRVVVGHGIPFRAVAGGQLLDEGEAAVIEPRGDGFRVAARVAKDAWPALK
jgi:broad specificity phosphatase PhoE